MYEVFERGLRAAAYFTVHIAIALLIIEGIYLIKLALAWMGDPRLFNFVPISYIFDAMDIFVLLVFIVFGTREAYLVMREHDAKRGTNGT